MQPSSGSGGEPLARTAVRLQNAAVTAVPALQELARLVAGEPETALPRLLALVREQVAMDVAFVSATDRAGAGQVHAVQRVGAPDRPANLVPQDARWRDLVLAEGGLLVADVRTRPELAALASTQTCRIGSYVGVPLRDEDGAGFGVLCAYGYEPHDSLNARDRDVLTGLAEVIAPLVRGADAVRSAPPLALETVAQAIDGVDGLEQLTRPLLDALADLTGLASTYLTVVDDLAGAQEIRYARNSRSRFEMPEGLVVPWEDTLCKRALEEGRPCITEVPTVWGDSEAARSLGIQVYVSVPVELPDGRLWGTLCAADSVRGEDTETHLPTMRLFARLLGAQAEREEALRQAREDAERDPLTGCASRRVVEPWLARELAASSPGETLVVAYADLNSFKHVNDTLGHAAGDAVLAEVGRRLRAIARPHDLVARIGGDEFLVAARLPRGSDGRLAERVRTALAFSLDWQGSAVQVSASVGSASAEDHDASSVVAVADAAMYDAKRAHRSGVESAAG